ncbi:MAG TPA: YbaB/EbfC family nucleoid-associated protein [Pseudonocardiaceae bacterium]|nr:YbaB/EbfC family nucleoid-associated protein [Pseudonocardiaceae bacterium]
MADSPDGSQPVELDGELAQLKAKADLAQARVREAMETVSAEDGAATVTVGPGGALVDLKFTKRAYQRPPQELAATVMKLVAKGQQKVSAKVMAAFGGLVGENSKAMEVLTEFLPADPGDEDEGETTGQRWGAIEEQPGPAQRPPARQAPPPQPWSGSGPQAPQQPRQPSRPAPRPQQRRPRLDDQDDDFQQPW